MELNAVPTKLLVSLSARMGKFSELLAVPDPYDGCHHLSMPLLDMRK